MGTPVHTRRRTDKATQLRQVRNESERGPRHSRGNYSPVGDASLDRKQTMKNKAVKIGIIATIAPHIFCCGIPMLLAIIGLIAPDAAHFHILPHWMEPWLFIFSGAMLGLSWYLVLRDCSCCCEQCGGKTSHGAQRVILTVITVIFVISLILHLLSHHH